MEMKLSDTDMRDAFFDGVYETAKIDKNVIFLTCDHSAFSLIKFEKDFPNQYINMGISEQNMASVSAGLALCKKTVYMYGIAPFVTLRCLEQINIDICSMNLNVNIVSMGTGLTYSNDGPTHHGIQDQAIMSILPNMTIYNVSDPVNSDAFAKKCHDENGPKIIRIEKGKFPILYQKNQENFFDGLSILKEGTDLVIISTGIMVQRAISIANKLKKNNINASVIDVYRIKPLNQELLLTSIENFKEIIVIEENIFTGGLGSMVGTLIAEKNLKSSFKRFALKDQYCFQSGPREWMQEKFGLGEEKIVEYIER